MDLTKRITGLASAFLLVSTSALAHHLPKDIISLEEVPDGYAYVYEVRELENQGLVAIFRNSRGHTLYVSCESASADYFNDSFSTDDYIYKKLTLAKMHCDRKEPYVGPSY